MKLTSDIVRLLRTTKGIDQRSLAKETGISQALICMIETGKMRISPKNNQRLIRFFNLSEADIIHAQNVIQMSKRFK